MSMRAQRLLSEPMIGVSSQAEWAWGVGAYLALSSAGAGAYVVWQACALLDATWTLAGRAGAVLGIALVMLGALLILFDLGRWLRFYKAALRPRVSWESRAFLIIVAFTTLGCLQVAGWMLASPWVDALSMPMVLLAFVLLCYGALLLRGMRAYPLWRHPLQLALYPASGLLAGCGALALDVGSVLTARHIGLLAGAIVVLAVLNLLLLAAVLCATRASRDAGSASVQALLTGVHAPLFWAGAVALGIVVPLVLAAPVWFGTARASMLQWAGMGSLGGLVILRYVFLAAAYRPNEFTFDGAGPWGMSR
jgi:formate-dependent nitrite reductase membrane component NrfD